MKRTTLSLVMLACLVVVLLVVTAFTAVSTASAQLGNTGVPVRCSGTASTTNPSSLLCKSADGLTFTNVPASHYLMVTDVVAAPSSASGTYWAYIMHMVDSVSPPDGSLEFRSSTSDTFGWHFAAPYLVLSPGRYLGVMITASSGNVNFYVSGLLTTSVSFLPLVTR